MPTGVLESRFAGALPALVAVHVSIHINILDCKVSVVSDVWQIEPRGPFNRLLFRFRVESKVNNDKVVGTASSELLCKFKVISVVLRALICDGIVPVNLFPCKFKVVKTESAEIWDGIVLLKELPRSTNEVRNDRRLILSLNLPISALLLRSNPIGFSFPPLPEQVMPVQVVARVPLPHG